MSKWEEKIIASLGKVITGKTPSKAEPIYWNGEELFVSPKDMKRDSLYIYKTQTTISNFAFEKFKSQVIPKNSVMYTALSFGFGKIGIASKDLITNQQINSIIVNEENDFRFIYYLLRVNTPYIFMYNSGIETPFVPKSVFEKIKLLVPPLSIQQKISHILSAYDDLIENNNRRIELLEKAAENLYKEWFVRFRFPKYKESKFENGLPQGWKVVKVKNIVNRLPFGKLYKEKDLFSEGKVIVIDQSQKDYVGFHNNKPSHKASIDAPIIIFGDHSCKMQLMINKFSLSENVVPFISKNDIPIVFLYYLVNSLIETTEYKRHWTEFMSRKVLLPQKHLTEMFQKQVESNMVLINNLQIQNRNLIKQRDLLLPRLMSGKLEV